MGAALGAGLCPGGVDAGEVGFDCLLGSERAGVLPGAVVIEVVHAAQDGGGRDELFGQGRP